MIASHVNRDAALIFLSAFVRTSTIGLTGVIVAIYLARRSDSRRLRLGSSLAVGLAGGAVATLVVGVRGDLFGRRRSLVTLALLTAFGYAVLAIADRLVVLAPLAFVAMLNGMGRDRGAASAVDAADARGAIDHRWHA